MVIETRRRRVRHEKERGFTLIELLVVIAVLAILAAVVIFNIIGVRQNASSTSCKTDLATVQSAAEAYRVDTGGYATSIDQLVPTYMHTEPTDLGTVDMNSDGHGTVTSSACS